ncbi:MAG TPA: TetR/AcrR family transcriptional regulator [Thermomicrobiales bacterium]|nr:TetR/AcrR family transcriptional regulator [Thermomicrobiales bacterium]
MDDSANPKRRTAEERREEIIAAAIVEFATFGYHGGSTERIAEAAGISQPYTLRLFKTKKAIFLAALHRVCDNITATWATTNEHLDRLGRTPPPSPSERLESMGISFMTLVKEVNDLRLVLQAFSSAEDDDIRTASHARLKQMFDWVRETTGAPFDSVREFFAYGMMLMVAASIRAADDVATEPWARAFLAIPTDPDGNLVDRLSSPVPLLLKPNPFWSNLDQPDSGPD